VAPRVRARFAYVTTHDLGSRRIHWRPRMILLVSIAVAGLVAIVVLTTVAFHAAQPGPKPPPQPAKPFSIGELGHSGSQVSLAAFAGQPVVVNFFASWCGPCQRETPLLAKFYAAHHGQVRVIGVDANDRTAAALKFVRKEQVSYPVGVDPFPAKTTTSYGVFELPQTFFLNARHQIVRHVVGALTARELSSWAAGAGSGSGGAGGSGS
jgi:cytochrome c biogenesis protein CcmG/thiol:disulfide interchange protein DsbE